MAFKRARIFDSESGTRTIGVAEDDHKPVLDTTRAYTLVAPGAERRYAQDGVYYDVNGYPCGEPDEDEGVLVVDEADFPGPIEGLDEDGDDFDPYEDVDDAVPEHGRIVDADGTVRAELGDADYTPLPGDRYEPGDTDDADDEQEGEDGDSDDDVPVSEDAGVDEDDPASPADDDDSEDEGA